MRESKRVSLKCQMMQSESSPLICFCFCLHLASEKISENMHIIANDPSLAFYRMQEHIRKGK